jgi:hypothetical protein
MSFISIIWGNTPKKRNLHDAGLYPHLNTQEHFTADFWLTAEQQEKLQDVFLRWSKKAPKPIEGFQIIRGAFHGFYTRLRPAGENWGWGSTNSYTGESSQDYSQEYDQLLDDIAEAIGWYHVRIDGANAVVKQSPEEYGDKNTTWRRWKHNNPSSHLREASKKNWEIYHEFIGDLGEAGEFDEFKFQPENWRKNEN